jgi:hypothetical protein
MTQDMTRGLFVFFALMIAGAPSGAAPADDAAPVECAEYASKLESCSPYSCTFTHPMTGAELERKIIGLTGGICATVEAMPGGHTLRCEFPADVRKSVAAFFRKTQGAEAGKIDGKITVDGGGRASSTTNIDGKPVANPLQQALESGICKVGR